MRGAFSNVIFGEGYMLKISLRVFMKGLVASADFIRYNRQNAPTIDPIR